MEQNVDAAVEQVMGTLTHKENCVLVTIGGNKVGWTSAAGRKFSFSFFDDGCTEDSGSWGAVLGDEMGDFGITSRRGAGAVLSSLRKKGLMKNDGVHEEGDFWWSLTALGAKVALALNEKDWK